MGKQKNLDNFYLYSHILHRLLLILSSYNNNNDVSIENSIGEDIKVYKNYNLFFRKLQWSIFFNT